MVPNAGFWANYCRQVHVRALKGFRAGALEKVAPAFESIAEDADRATEAEYERLGSMPYDGQTDMSDVAEMAQDHSIADYETMSGVRQGVLNVLAVGLYHLFEQQQLFFLRREPAFQGARKRAVVTQGSEIQEASGRVRRRVSEFLMR